MMYVCVICMVCVHVCVRAYGCITVCVCMYVCVYAVIPHETRPCPLNVDVQYVQGFTPHTHMHIIVLFI